MRNKTENSKKNLDTLGCTMYVKNWRFDFLNFGDALLLKKISDFEYLFIYRICNQLMIIYIFIIRIYIVGTIG